MRDFIKKHFLDIIFVMLYVAAFIVLLSLNSCKNTAGGATSKEVKKVEQKQTIVKEIDKDSTFIDVDDPFIGLFYNEKWQLFYAGVYYDVTPIYIDDSTVEIDFNNKIYILTKGE